MARKSAASPRPGDHVEWNTPQGKTTGVVTRKISGRAKAGGHTAQASAAEPQYEVRSEKSGRTAIHKPQALKRVRGGRG